MTRTHQFFDCGGERLAGTLDQADSSTGLLIVSGGNEIRSGAHAGMARLSSRLAAQGFPVFRYDRRGIGESTGRNGEFLASQPDICAAVSCFRSRHPAFDRIVAFGNCDAATALAFFGRKAGIDALILANPWTIETVPNVSDDKEPTTPPPSALRARYWDRLKNPETILDLLKGKINVIDTLKGLKQASKKQKNNALSIQLRNALAHSDVPTQILLAKRDTTARAFQAAWASKDFDDVRTNSNISLTSTNTASHSFADHQARIWLENQIVGVLSEN